MIASAADAAMILPFLMPLMVPIFGEVIVGGLPVPCSQAGQPSWQGTMAQ